jgi:hypothetical protein
VCAGVLLLALIAWLAPPEQSDLLDLLDRANEDDALVIEALLRDPSFDPSAYDDLVDRRVSLRAPDRRRAITIDLIGEARERIDHDPEGMGLGSSASFLIVLRIDTDLLIEARPGAVTPRPIEASRRLARCDAIARERSVGAIALRAQVERARALECWSRP